MQVDISYLNISFGIQNRVKNKMINFMILLAKYYINTSKYKQNNPIFEGFKNIKTNKRNRTLHCLYKDTFDYHNQKWIFLGTVL